MAVMPTWRRGYPVISPSCSGLRVFRRRVRLRVEPAERRSPGQTEREAARTGDRVVELAPRTEAARQVLVPDPLDLEAPGQVRGRLRRPRTVPRHLALRGTRGQRGLLDHERLGLFDCHVP